MNFACCHIGYTPVSPLVLVRPACIKLCSQSLSDSSLARPVSRLPLALFFFAFQFAASLFSFGLSCSVLVPTSRGLFFSSFCRLFLSSFCRVSLSECFSSRTLLYLLCLTLPYLSWYAQFVTSPRVVADIYQHSINR